MEVFLSALSSVCFKWWCFCQHWPSVSSDGVSVSTDTLSVSSGVVSISTFLCLSGGVLSAFPTVCFEWWCFCQHWSSVLSGGLSVSTVLCFKWWSFCQTALYLFQVVVFLSAFCFCHLWPSVCFKWRCFCQYCSVSSGGVSITIGPLFQVVVFLSALVLCLFQVVVFLSSLSSVWSGGVSISTALFFKWLYFYSPDVILCGWLGWKHQLTKLYFYQHWLYVPSGGVSVRIDFLFQVVVLLSALTLYFK